MAKKTIDFLADLPKVQKFIDKRVRDQVNAGGDVAGIVIGMKLCQAGFLVLRLNTDEQHERDEQWMEELDAGPSLKLPAWSKAYMESADHGIEFIMLNGSKKKVAPGAGDNAVVSVIGKTMLAILGDAKARGVFKSLPITKDCQVEFREFDWMWEWPENEEDLGETNLFRKLRSTLITASQSDK
ncbi:MAG: hypothetical protein JWM57_2893 [Phycisphaerales bacterium]|nr:hypothetical protein [Phycisphaerales bacterium]